MKGPEKFFRKIASHIDEVPKLSRRNMIIGGLGVAGLSLAARGYDAKTKGLVENNKARKTESSDTRICTKTFSGKDPNQVEWTDPDCMEWTSE